MKDFIVLEDETVRVNLAATDANEDWIRALRVREDPEFVELDKGRTRKVVSLSE